MTRLGWWIFGHPGPIHAGGPDRSIEGVASPKDAQRAGVYHSESLNRIELQTSLSKSAAHEARLEAVEEKLTIVVVWALSYLSIG